MRRQQQQQMARQQREKSKKPVILDGMDWQPLQGLGRFYGVYRRGMKRPELEAAIEKAASE